MLLNLVVALLFFVPSSRRPSRLLHPVSSISYVPMSALDQLSDGSEGTQPDSSGSHQNGSINLSDSEAKRSAQLLSACPGFPESKGQTIHLTGGVLTPNVAAQLPFLWLPPAINFGGTETTSLLHPLN